MRALVLLTTFTLVDAATARDYPESVTFPRLPNELANFCFECHDSSSAEAEIDLEAMETAPLDPSHAARLLEEIRWVVEAGDMPPEESDQPSDAEREVMLEWVEERLDELATTFEDDPGIVAMPRLNPYEYRNAIRDLSGGVVLDAGRYLPSEGGAGEGFSNVGLAQSMTSVQLEKYLEAAKGALSHLTITPADGMVWREIARPNADSPAALRQQLIDDILAWHAAQQQKWNADHQQQLADRFGFSHAAYLIAAWHYRHQEGSKALEDFASYRNVKLSIVALEKWWGILNDPDGSSIFADWSAAWRALPGPDAMDDERLREECVAITSGKRGGSLKVNEETYAPPYEISFHEARDEVLESAEKEGVWPFRIDIGDADELFLVMTDAGDGNRNEYGVWRRGRILFQDGSAKDWQDVVQVHGANSGNPYPFGIDGEGAKTLPPDAIGVRPPGALKFAVPEGASVFEVNLTLDENRTDKASIQALVLKEKPRSQSHIPNRYVFGGKARAADADNEENKQRGRMLRKRNIAEANRTKIGLNAERNVFANWKHTGIEFLGGPWPDQEVDKEEPGAPYHYTVAQLMRVATGEDLQVLKVLQDRLESVAQVPQQELVRFARSHGWGDAKEGVLPPEEVVRGWDATVRAESRRRMAGIRQQEKDLAQRAAPWIESFALQAWGRPLSEAERASLQDLYLDSRNRGYAFDSAVKAALLFVLTSPDFLYRLGPDPDAPADGPTRLSGHQLANRLSFFLWASLPDAELRKLAEQGELSDPDVLRSQARRMLRDPRARSLATDFAGQLWDFSEFKNFTNPDEIRFATFDAGLRQAMMAEVIEFLDDLFRNDRSLTALIDADYTYANGPLARHYDIDGVTGDETIRVEVDPAQRGGLVGMGLFLTKTSLPLRTSPVQRGVWLLEKLLGRELPNPPAEVASISDDATNPQGQTILQQLEAHREDAGCASCHDRIDPLGIALENFDAIGRWRETLTNTAVAHDGTPLSGVVGLKNYLSSQQEAIFEHFHRKLLGYALGRSVGPGDRKLLRRMAQTFRTSGHRLTPLIEEIVGSPQFRNSRQPSPASDES